MVQALTDYYRCPDELVRLRVSTKLGPSSGYFRIGKDVTGYGRCTLPPRDTFADDLPDVSPLLSGSDGILTLPFDPDEAIDNLRSERYCRAASRNSIPEHLAKRAYYSLRPMLPIRIRKHLQRLKLHDWQHIPFPSWPVDTTVDRFAAALLALCVLTNDNAPIPFVWFWPDDYSACAIMTHDVEQDSGRAFCHRLMDLDERYQVRSSFQIIPERRYRVADDFLESIRTRGFEVNVHDLAHDGRLFDDHECFLARAAKINDYATKWGAEGFRAGCTYRNVDWYDALTFAYDMSVPNVAHLEPQRGGCCTVMPYFVGNVIELPLTTTEDYSLFHILGEYSTVLWRRQLETILATHGLAAFVVHPDYILESRPRDVYAQLLDCLADLRREERLWLPLPREVARWWQDRNRMRVVRTERGWAIVGPGSERARLAFAVLDGGRLVYSFDGTRYTSGLPATQATH